MASSTAAARLHQASCAIRERASCGVALLVQPSLAAVGGALLRAVGSMSLSHWCHQLFELERRFSGRAAPFAVALVVGCVAVLACERQREKAMRVGGTSSESAVGVVRRGGVHS
eukprot:6382883-Prymnesium_polylepis.1